MSIFRYIFTLLTAALVMSPVYGQTDTVCASNPSNLYYVIGSAGSTFTWDTQGNGVITGQGNDSITVAWTNVPGNYSLSVIERNAEGCYGLPQVIQVTVLPNWTSLSSVSVCSNDIPFTWNGTNYSLAGIYTYTTTGAYGCDSIATLDLSITPPVPPVLTCGSSTLTSVQFSWPSLAGATLYAIEYTINGGSIIPAANQPGTSFTVNSLNPGDDVSITVTPLGGLGTCFSPASATCTAQDCTPPTFDEQPEDAQVCPGQEVEFEAEVSGATSFQWQVSTNGGATYTNLSNGGVYSGVQSQSLEISDPAGLTNNLYQLVAFETSGACSSISNSVSITILSASSAIDVQTACGSFTWIDGNTYSSSTNTPTFTIAGGSVSGCDSVITLNLTINNSVTATDVQTACGSFTWIDGNTYSSSTNTPTLTIPNGSVTGCDSIITLNLTVNSFTSGIDTQTACGSFTWIDGNTYSTSTNTPTFTIPNGSVSGCDSIITLNLTINSFTTGIDSQTACGSFTWIDGNTYSASTNTPTFTIAGGSVSGCDSVITLNLTINNSVAGTDVQSACGSYTWIDGNTYSASTNTPTFTIPNGSVSGCDSIITLNLTVNSFTTGIDTQSACGSFTWIDGNTYSASTNIPTFTIAGGAVSGCDSVITLNLTINNSVTATDVQSACGSFTWIDGNTYSASTNTPTFTIAGGSVSGCDSVITLNLTINNSVTSTDVQIACGSFTWIDGNTYSTSTNTPTFTIAGSSVSGCDSVITLNLTINNSVTATDVQTACGSFTWIDGNTYSSSTNTPTFTIAGGSVSGCDSVIALNLTINYSVASTDVQSACGSFTWIDGNTYSASTNTPTFTIVGGSVSGCDSVITLNLTINNSVTATDVQTACGNFTWIDGNTYSSSTNTPTFTIAGGSVSGCDSIITLNLTINTFTTGIDSQTACGSYTWIDGNTYSASTNTPTFTIPNGSVSGCDSIITLNLTINSFTTGIDVQSACGSYVWIDGNTYSSSTNTPTFTIAGGAVSGCDSVITLNLTINNSVASTDVQTACGSFTWIDGNTYSASTNTPTFTIPNGSVSGCDSIITLNLTINSFTAGIDSQTACGSFTWIDGNTYSSSTNTPTFTIAGGSVSGCDSVITLNLTVNNSVAATDVQTACGSFTWIDGNTYSTSTNTPTFTIPNGSVSGCDSVITLNLTINNSVTGTDVQSACGSFTWIDGITYSSSTNTPTFTIAGGSITGCDSVITLNLTINNSVATTDVQTACGSFTWIDGNTYSSSTNTPTFTIAGGSVSGCDSIITLNLTINSFTSGIDVQTACGSFTWIDGNTYSSSTITPTFTIVGGSVSGCDSVITLNLTINSFTTGIDTQSACGSFTWIDGNTYSASTNSPTFTIANGSVSGCDSIITLNLTINSFTTGIDTQIACGSFTWIDGNTYSASTNTPTFTIANGSVSGCDSIITLNLTINSFTSGIDSQTACGSFTWIDGNTYSASTNTPTFTIPNGSVSGCDSIITLNLTINSFTTGIDTQTACGSFTWIDGNTYSASTNTPTFTIPNGSVSGCDSVITLNLTINNSVASTDVQSACGSFIWIDGNTYSASTNTPTFTIAGGSVLGCDSVITLNLTINNSVATTDVQTACGSFTWIDGNTYSASTNTPTFTIAGGSVSGCDSIITLNLTINSFTSGIDSQTACGSYTWIDGNTYSASTNTPTFTIAGGSVSGCDSVITLNLTINNSVAATDVQSACGSFTWIDGNTYSSSTNTPTFTIPNGSITGCDSIITLNLTINSFTSGIDSQTACGSFTWIDGNTYSASTSTPTFTIVGGSVSGCDSVITLNLTINNSVASTDVQSACGSYTWIDGNTYSASTSTPTFTIPNGSVSGCDSIITLNLTINSFTTGIDSQTACGSFTWIDGNTYSTSTNTPTFTIPNGSVSGCDSIITLNLTINTFASGIDTQSACGSFTWIDGNTYSASTSTPTFTIAGGAVSGCDSVITLNLTISNSVASTDVQTACGSFTWIDGNTYSASTSTPTFTIPNGSVSGCDSVITLNLTINSFTTGIDTQTVCGSFTWIDGNTYSASTNTPTFTIAGGSVSGCDSVITLNLTINNSVTKTDVQIACGSFTWIDGNTYSSSTNTPTFTIPNGSVTGCDSIITLNLTINSFTTGIDTQTACGIFTWIDGNTYSSSTNTPTFTIAGGSVSGCDSIITLNLTINNSVTATDVQAACGSYTWIDGNTYSASTNTPTFTIAGGSVSGCDSVITLNLTINNSVASTDVQTACGSFTWIDGNTYSASTNTPTFTIPNGSVSGCDSVITLNLTINNSVASTDVQSACGSFTWIDGNTYSASTNTPTFTIAGGSVSGCDSIITLNLTINSFTSGIDTQSACGSFTWIDGNTYSASTSTPTFTIAGGSILGCDSIITLNLTINNSVFSTDFQTACGSFTWIDGNTYSASTNTPTFTIAGGSVSGCDSVITLNLTINNSVAATDVQSACGSFTWIDGNTYSASTSTPTFTIPNGSVSGCDSIITLNLTINSFTTGIDTQSACGSFTWIDGNTYSASTNSPTFTIANGSVSGCDSIITLNLTINSFTTGIDTQIACGSFTWIDGNTYSASTNTPTFTIANGSVSGCDSIITLNLTINSFTSGIDTQSACGSFTWIDGNTYSASTSTPTFTIAGGSILGCDSVITLNLTINNSVTSSDVQIACGSYTWIDGNTYSASTNTPTFTIPNGSVSGCDSIITLNLSINQNINFAQSIQLCNGQSYTLPDGSNVSTEGVYPVTLIASTGCDSTITTTISNTSEITTSQAISICSGSSFILPDGNPVNQEGIYPVTLQSSAGCDSIITTIITILNPINISQNVEICSGQTFELPGGGIANTSDTYITTLSAQNGCDSTITTILTVLPPPSSTQNISICNGGFLKLPDGSVVSSSGNYPITIQSDLGCDSLIITNLNVLPAIADTLIFTICQGDSIQLPNGNFVTDANDYTFNNISANGCDSIVHIIVQIDLPGQLIVSPDSSICQGETIELFASGGSQYTWISTDSTIQQSGNSITIQPDSTVQLIVNTTFGTCTVNDSVVVTVNPAASISISPSQITICQGDSVQLQATGADEFVWTPASFLTCDTCANPMAYPDSSMQFTIAGSLGNCADQTTISIQVIPPISASISADTSICYGDTLTLSASGGQSYLWSNNDTTSQISISPDQTGSISVVVSTGFCNDTAQFNYYVWPTPFIDAGTDTTIHYGGTAQLSALTNNAITWSPVTGLSCSDCPNPIASPLVPTVYCAYITNQFGCQADDCIKVNVDTICPNLFIPNVFAPNAGGHAENDCFKLFGADCIKSMELTIYNRWGEKVFNSTNINDCWDGKFKGKDENSGVFIYYLNAKLIDGEELIKQGNVTLLR